MDYNIFKDVNDNEYIVPANIIEGVEIAQYIVKNCIIDTNTKTVILIEAAITPAAITMHTQNAFNVILVDDKQTKPLVAELPKINNIKLHSLPTISYTPSFIPKHDKPWYARFDKRKKRK